MAKLFSVTNTKRESTLDKVKKFQALLRRWKKKYEEAEIREELVSRKEFVKPSLQKRIQKQKAVRENQKQVQLNKIENGQ